MRKELGILVLLLLLLACQNKISQEYSPTLIEIRSDESYQQPDTAVAEKVEGQQEEVKTSSTSTSSISSHSRKQEEVCNI